MAKKKEKISEKEIRHWQGLLKMAQRRKEDFQKEADYFQKLYCGDRIVGSGDEAQSSDRINVNMIYANVETQKPSIFFDNPKILIRPKVEKVYAGRDSRTKEEVYLEGRGFAYTVERAVNAVLKEINMKHNVSRVRDDALIKGMGVLWLGYNAEFGIDEEENEYLKGEEIFAQFLPVEDFFIDPELKEHDLSKARWVARRMFIPLQDIKDNKEYYENTDEDIPTKNAFSDAEREKFDEDLQNDPANKRVEVFEIWARPTPKEKREGKKGKVIVIPSGANFHLRIDDWPHSLDSFPCRIAAFNIENGKFWPFSDIKIYLDQVYEKILIRNAQLEQAGIAGNVVVLYNSDSIDEDTAQEIISARNRLIGLKLGDKKIGDVLQVVTPGSVSQEYYSVDAKVDRDIDQISGITDLKMGGISARKQSATEASIQQQGSDARSNAKFAIFMDFYVSVVKAVIQLMKQYYKTDRIRRLVGSDDVVWFDHFSQSNILDELEVDIDIASALPFNDVVRRKQAMDLLNLAIGAVGNPTVIQQLEGEGKTIQLTELIRMVLESQEIKNEKIFVDIPSTIEGGFQLALGDIEMLLNGQMPPTQSSDSHKIKVQVFSALLGVLSRVGGPPELIQALQALIDQHQAMLQQEEQGRVSGGAAVNTELFSQAPPSVGQELSAAFNLGPGTAPMGGAA